MVRLALYQPDIPQNTGTILRLGACFGAPIDIIEPCGFAFDDRKLKRAGVDYLDRVDWRRHNSWERFRADRPAGRLVLLTTKAEETLGSFRFEPTDTLLFGRESAGVPDDVHDAADARVRIPMQSGLRSLNIAVSASIALWEALRQTGIPGETAEAVRSA